MVLGLVLIYSSIILHEVYQIKAYEIWKRYIISVNLTVDSHNVDLVKVPFQKPLEVVGTLGKQNNNEIAGRPSALNDSNDLEKAMELMSTASMAPSLLTNFGDIGGGAHFSGLVDMVVPNKAQDTKSALKALKVSEEPEVPKIIELEVEVVPQEQVQEHSVPRSASQSISEG